MVLVQEWSLDNFYYRFLNLGSDYKFHAFNLNSDTLVGFHVTHSVNLWPLAFWLEWTTCCLPADITGNLESRSKLLYASLTFLHNAQWGLISQLRIFRLTDPIEITSCKQLTCGCSLKAL